MTDEELNKGIAEWCGWKTKTLKEAGTWWASPESPEEYFYHEPPHFLDDVQGLGLLFKYAVPKLLEDIRDLVSIDFSPASDDDNRWACLLGYSRMSYHEDVTLAPTPTRALAMAIWKVIKEDNETETTIS